MTASRWTLTSSVLARASAIMNLLKQSTFLNIRSLQTGNKNCQQCPMGFLQFLIGHMEDFHLSNKNPWAGQVLVCWHRLSEITYMFKFKIKTLSHTLMYKTQVCSRTPFLAVSSMPVFWHIPFLKKCVYVY